MASAQGPCPVAGHAPIAARGERYRPHFGAVRHHRALELLRRKPRQKDFKPALQTLPGVTGFKGQAKQPAQSLAIGSPSQQMVKQEIVHLVRPKRFLGLLHHAAVSRRRQQLRRDGGIHHIE